MLNYDQNSAEKSRAMLTAQLDTALIEYMVPDHNHEGLREYIICGRPLGSFLEAAIANDLSQAFGRADETNAFFMRNTVMFLYNVAPIACRGSYDAYLAWVKKGGILADCQKAAA